VPGPLKPPPSPVPAPGISRIEGWMGPRTGLDALGRKNLFLRE